MALISGRTAADLAGRVRIGGATYLGNHGVERGHLPRRSRAETLRIEVAPLPPHFTALAEAMAANVERAMPEPWMVVERKLPAVTFHYRGAPDVAAGRRPVAADRGRHRPGSPDDPLRGPSRPGAAPTRRPGQGRVDALRSSTSTAPPSLSCSATTATTRAPSRSCAQHVPPGRSTAWRSRWPRTLTCCRTSPPMPTWCWRDPRETASFLSGLARILAARIPAD